MAEAIAIIGLVSSITSLIQVSAKVIARLREYASKTVDVPETFSALSSRLPLLTATLQRIHSQSESGQLSTDVAKALKAIVDTTAEQVSIVHIYLSKVLPSSNASKFERAFKALRSLPKDEKVQLAMKKIHENIDFLVLHQTTRHVDMGDRIIEELANMSIALSRSPVTSDSLTSFGKCLGNAPMIAPDAFVGRKAELLQLRNWLSPKSLAARHHIVSIVGMGGMGKTQLSLAHVRDCGSDYTSVFWLNAKDETSLKQSMAELSFVIFPTSTINTALDANEEKKRIEKVRQWLSAAGNDQWLLILDNYDDPDLPGAQSSTGYDIRPFLPPRSQGGILITSRSTKLAFSTQLKLQKIEDDSTSVTILSRRCGRDLSADIGVIELVQRLGGLPLALATAGSFLRSIEMSCAEYLALYKTAWTDLVGPDNEALLEYETRTLSSTWTISLDQIRNQDKDAATLLEFFAYLGNNDIWYELLQGGAGEDAPWLEHATQSKIHFQRTMSKLVDYSLVDVVAGSYQLHPCLHDWLVSRLKDSPDPQLFITAVVCVSECVDETQATTHWTRSRRLFEHIEQLESPRFNRLWNRLELDKHIYRAAHVIGEFEERWDLFDRSERMYRRALRGKEKKLGYEHRSTLSTLNNLGILYEQQDKLNKAEKIYLRTLKGKERVHGPEHHSTLYTVHNLGLLYRRQGKLDKAEEMYLRALAGKEKTLGTDHESIFFTTNNLAVVYERQDKLDQAEEMYRRTLKGKEKTLGPKHTSTLDTVHNLGVLYKHQGKLKQAEELYQRALDGSEELLGPEHTSTLDTVYSLAILYVKQGKLDAAEKMYHRALDGYLKSRGPSHEATLDTCYNLGLLYESLGRPDEAEEMFERAEPPSREG